VFADVRANVRREEAIERGEDPDAAEAAIRAEMEGSFAEEVVEPEPYVEPAEPEIDPNAAWQQGGEQYGYGYGYDQGGAYGYDQGVMMMSQPVYDPNAAMGYDPNAFQPAPVGENWTNVEDVDMAFGMWMEHLEDTTSPIKPEEVCWCGWNDQSATSLG
jgi:hypothetical protein